MRYHQIKTKIDKVLMSCEVDAWVLSESKNMGVTYCTMLIDRYLTGYDKETMAWYLKWWFEHDKPPFRPPMIEFN